MIESMSPLLIVVLFLILWAEFVNGWTDAPNAIATVVSTRVLSPRKAIILATTLNTLGAFSGIAVATTIGKGRGAFAGPLVAGCVVLNAKVKPPKVIKIDDSKRLSEKQRELSAEWIRKNALSWGVGSVSAKYIDKFGLTKASNMAFRKAIRSASKKLEASIEHIIIDAFYIPFVKGLPQHRQFAIVGADRKSASVAAASIIAKVYRDHLMEKLGKNSSYKKYHWDENKGYGTATHREALKKYGKSIYHRSLFLRKLLY